MTRLRTLLRRVRAPGEDYGERIRAIEQRMRRLETQVEGFQDSVHRESVRRDRDIHELQSKTEPSELSRALSRDARERGI
jgi:hypothetical protein